MRDDKNANRDLVAGIVGAPRGLRGEVTIEVRTDNPQLRFAEGAILRTDYDNHPELTVSGFSLNGGKARAFFEEITTREGAELITGAQLLVEETSEEDAWYPHELVGLRVVDLEGNQLGVTRGLKFGAAQDLLEVDQEGTLVQVPFVEALVPAVDPAAGQIIVDAPAGLFNNPGVTD